MTLRSDNCILGNSRKDPHSPTEEISAVRRKRGEIYFYSKINVLGCSKGVEGVWMFLTMMLSGVDVVDVYDI